MECFHTYFEHSNTAQNIRRIKKITAELYEYTCKDGYEAAPGRLTADVKCFNGLWDNFICEKACDPLPTIPNGRYKNVVQCVPGAISVSKTCAISCDIGFTAFEALATCLPDGTWRVPKCTREQIDKNLNNKSFKNNTLNCSPMQTTNDIETNCQTEENSDECQVQCLSGVIDQTATKSVTVACRNGNWLVVATGPSRCALEGLAVSALSCSQKNRNSCGSLNSFVFGPAVVQCVTNPKDLKSVMNLSDTFADSTRCDLLCEDAFEGYESTFASLDCREGVWDVQFFGRNRRPLSPLEPASRLVCRNPKTERKPGFFGTEPRANFSAQDAGYSPKSGCFPKLGFESRVLSGGVINGTAKRSEQASAAVRKIGSTASEKQNREVTGLAFAGNKTKRAEIENDLKKAMAARASVTHFGLLVLVASGSLW